MKYLWKDVKHRNLNTLENMLTPGVFELKDVDPSGSLLNYACQCRYKDVLTILLKYNSPITCNRSTGLTPLHTSVKLGDNPMTAILISHGVTLETQSLFEHKTALHFAVREKNIGIIRMLLDQNAHVNAQDIYGSAAIHYAAQSGEESIVMLLLEHQADLELRDKEGWSALHFAADEGHQHLVRLFLKRGADISAQTRYGKTALHLVCHRGHMSIAQILLDFKSTADVKDLHDKTPVDYCRNPTMTSLVLNAIQLTDGDMEDIKHIDMNINSTSLIDLLDPEYLSDNYYSCENLVTNDKGNDSDSVTVDLESLDQGMQFAQSEPSLSESGTSRELFFLSHLRDKSHSSENIPHKNNKPSAQTDLDTIVEVHSDNSSSSRKSSQQSTQVLFTSNDGHPSIVATEIMSEVTEKNYHHFESQTATSNSGTLKFSAEMQNNKHINKAPETDESRSLSLSPGPVLSQRRHSDQIPKLHAHEISRCLSSGQIEDMHKKTCNHLDKSMHSIADVAQILEEIETSPDAENRGKKCEELKQLMKKWTVDISVFRGNVLSRSSSTVE